MEIRYPDYYKKFRCIAGDCPDTCCAGWEIAVDPESVRRYRRAQKTTKNRIFASKLRHHIQRGCIVHPSEGSLCPFLDSSGLCEIYRELGAQALCHTCKRHPRHLEDYGDLHELVLLLSCPEAARLILEEGNASFYVKEIPDKAGDMDGIDIELRRILLEARECIWEKVKGSKVTIEESMAFAAAFGHDLQKRLMQKNYDGANQILKRYGKAEVSYFVEVWKRKAKSKAMASNEKENGRFLLMSDFFDDLSLLEPIARDWDELLLDAIKKREQLADRQQDSQVFKEFLEQHPECPEQWKRLFLYFLYSFLMAALYDEDVLTKIKMSVLCTLAIAEMNCCCEKLDLNEQIRICHTLAREIENCNENRELMEKMLKKKRYTAKGLIDALLN